MYVQMRFLKRKKRYRKNDSIYAPDAYICTICVNHSFFRSADGKVCAEEIMVLNRIRIVPEDYSVTFEDPDQGPGNTIFQCQPPKSTRQIPGPAWIPRCGSMPWTGFPGGYVPGYRLRSQNRNPVPSVVVRFRTGYSEPLFCCGCLWSVIPYRKKRP